MKINKKQVGTFILLTLITGVAMAGDVEGTINNSTAKMARIFQAVAAGIGIVALMYEGIQLIAFKRPVLKQIAMIILGLVIVIGAAEIVNQFYGSGASGTGF